MHHPVLLPVVGHAVSLIARILRRIRRALLGLADQYRRQPNRYFAEAVRELAERRGALAQAVRAGQVASYAQAVKRVVRAIPLVPPPIVPPVPDAGHPDDQPGIRFPALDTATEWLWSHLDFPELERDAQRVSEVVAQAATADAAARIRAALSENLAQGGTYGQFRGVVQDAIGSGLLSDNQLDNVYRTQMARAYSAGQQAVLGNPLVRTAVPYLLYSATHDARVRPQHLWMERLGLNQTAIYRADDPIWKRFYPPWAWRCRCVVVPLSVADAALHGVREAKQWQRTGRPPANPEFVPPPPFDIPAGWTPTGPRLTPIV